MTARRSAARIKLARALWYTAPGRIEMRTASLPPLAPGHARVATQFTGVSRGTERLVLSGAVGASEWERMRAPLQEGAFPFPVKYGYCATGVVEDGPADLLGRTVFCLHPHQDLFDAPLGMLAVVPDGIPARRASLAANMETALNAHWDAGTGPGDRIAVVGAGVVGLLIAHLAARIPGTEVTVYDVDPSRRGIAEGFGCEFVDAGAIAKGAAPAPGSSVAPGDFPAGSRPPGADTDPGRPPISDGAAPAPDSLVAPDDSPAGSRSPGAEGATKDCDVVFHASVSAAGLDLAISLAGLEGTVVEMSWYGDKPVTIGLGDAFHSRRLKLVSSQVGHVSPGHRPRWSYARRLGAALRLLDDPALDLLVAEEIAFADAPKRLPELLAPGAPGLAPVIRY